MANHADPTKQLSPQRPRHRVSRSITEVTSPIRLHRNSRRYQDQNDLGPQSLASNLRLSRASLDLPRSESVTPHLVSPNQSRRASMLPSAAEEIGALAAAAAAASKERELQLERERSALRTSGLKTSLLDLNDFSIATTKRLDDTYFAVLEKLSMLQNTIVAMKGLAGMSADAVEDFETDSQGLVTEIETQLDAFGQFDEQQQRIEILKTRISQGRERVQKLSERVDIVRHRVESWERADKEWQERTRKRLKVVWIIMSVAALVLILLFIGAQYSPAAILDVTSTVKHKGLPSEAVTNSSKASARLSEDVRAALGRQRVNGQAAEEEVLQAFDEL